MSVQRYIIKIQFLLVKVNRLPLVYFQGRAIIETSSKAIVDQTGLEELNLEIQDDALHGHFPVMFGALCGRLELRAESVATMFLFATLKTVAASSVRLGSFGPLEVPNHHETFHHS